MSTYNLCGGDLDPVEAMTDALTEQGAWEFICLQETSVGPEGTTRTTQDGHLIVLGTGERRRNAVLVASWAVKWLEAWQEGVASPWVSLKAIRGSVRICSAHLPHSGYPEDDFHAALDDVTTIMGATDPSLWILGLDSNVCVCDEVAAVYPDTVGPRGWRTRRAADARAHAFFSWCQRYGLKAANTHEEGAPALNGSNEATHRQMNGGRLSCRDLFCAVCGVGSIIGVSISNGRTCRTTQRW